MPSSSGNAPSTGTPWRADIRAAPPSPNRCSAWPQALQTWTAMFSTRPSTGIETFSNIFSALPASSVATSCGVVTTTAPATGIFCAMVSWMSPVPGGRSTTSTSRSPQRVSLSSWVSAEVAIGPRQIVGASWSTSRPIDIASTPCARIGSMVLPSGLSGRPDRPSIIGTLGP
jgi:hypothetical protein